MKLRIAVAFGGESVEHEISILSAQQAMHAMDVTRYEIIPLYIAKDGSMYSHPSFMEVETFKDIEGCIERMESVSMIRRKQKFFIIASYHHMMKKEIEIDLVFPILHGTHGEDGSFQGYLTTLKIPFIGPCVLGGAIGQDKVIMKQVLQDSGLPVVPWFYWGIEQPLEEAFFKKAQRLGYPIIVKPANLGSSIGIGIAHNDVELHKVMIEAYQYDHKVVVEKVVDHLREINCSVLGDGYDCEISVLEEVIKQDVILSYEDKYVGQNKTQGMANTARQVPAVLEKGIAEEIGRYAKRTFQVLNASGVARIDFLLHDVYNEIYVNEINMIPGSLSFYLWEASNLSFPDLINRLVQLALSTYRKDQKIVYQYDTNILASYGQGNKGIK